MVIVARSQKSSKPAGAVVCWNDLHASADQPFDTLDHLLFRLASDADEPIENLGKVDRGHTGAIVVAAEVSLDCFRSGFIEEEGDHRVGVEQCHEVPVRGASTCSSSARAISRSLSLVRPLGSRKDPRAAPMGSAGRGVTMTASPLSSIQTWLCRAWIASAVDGHSPMGNRLGAHTGGRGLLDNWFRGRAPPAVVDEGPR